MSAPDSLEALQRHNDWLYGSIPCKCEHDYQSLGRLYDVNMGKGWVRTTTHPFCEWHGDKAVAYWKKHKHMQPHLLAEIKRPRPTAPVDRPRIII